MRVIVAGGRDINSYYLIERAIQESGFEISELVHGGCRGVDLTAERWARRNRINFKRMDADWDGHPERHITVNGHTYDPQAGNDRNRAMAEYAEAAICIWDGKSTGTKDMIEIMRSLNKPVRILRQVGAEEKCELL